MLITGQAASGLRVKISSLLLNLELTDLVVTISAIRHGLESVGHKPESAFYTKVAVLYSVRILQSAFNILY